MTADRRALFLPDVLPCPGPGLCDLHTALFGQSGAHDQERQHWFCSRCQKEHPVTVLPPSHVPATQNCLSRLESLPTELLSQINTYVLDRGSSTLPLASRTLYQKLGLNLMYPDFLPLLGRDMPAYATCYSCDMLRPYHSSLAWPLLQRCGKENETARNFYAVSGFLAVKMVQSHEDGYRNGLCPALLKCAGTFYKPWETHDPELIKSAGFGSEDIELGLAITYEASGRFGARTPAITLTTHVKYRINLPLPWVSYTVSQRAAILRKFYLCPHIFASKVQYRDNRDPTYPDDSSISHWASHQGPMPKADLTCSVCRAEMRSNAEFDEEERQHSIVFEVWREPQARCNDGFTELTFCKDTLARWASIKAIYDASNPV